MMLYCEEYAKCEEEMAHPELTENPSHINVVKSVKQTKNKNNNSNNNLKIQAT